ncbi:hypothetical protein K504DRAFT_446436 [Pleomassaria siparia CBS 279.74]|uniref:BTB/POZ domain-containing protein n=1 Tax=Pleomassaria siparia CBS 279.74 TaxID=1314801 RepID=A0A6G1KRS4_9PLEO|nr:hypothetical protein K504DRAFT_446436 [Pleomassaria siparia CBS 279.74]
MIDRFGHTTSRDFAFQSPDHSFAHHQLGGPVAATSTYTQHQHDRYDADRSSNVSNIQNVPAAPSSTNSISQSMQDASSSIRYSDFGPQQNSNPPQVSQPQFPPYSFSPGGPVVWDWTNAIEFPDFTNHYEPQGELVQEFHSQDQSANDFVIPLPIVNSDTVYHPPQAVQSTPLAMAQNPLSPPPKPPQRPSSLQTGMKRKAELEPDSAVSQPTSFSVELQHNPAKRVNKSRSSSLASITTPTLVATGDARRSSMTQSTNSPTIPDTVPATASGTNNDGQRRKEPGKGTGPQGRVIDVSKPRKIAESPAGHDTLPAGKVFPIQIGSELFRLSGASISSDAPSYFSHFFSEQLLSNPGRAGDLRTLYIDRDPDTFRDIALHLQGYHIKPRDGEHFVRLFADAQFYSLPRLTKQLFSEDIFVRIGGTPFQVPRDLFSSPGDSPNYFSLGFAQFFSTPTEVFPGLDRSALLRPPSISPPAVPNRSGETFAEIVKLLQGCKVDIRNETHRAQLLRDVRYFHLRGLEQKLIPCDISFNLKRNQSEILIRLEDIRQSGISFKPDGPPSNSSSGSESKAHSTSGRGSLGPGPSKSMSPAPSLSGHQPGAGGIVSYARPYTDDHTSTNVLVLEVSSSESTTLHFPLSAPIPSSDAPLSLDLRATFHANTLARITSLFSVVASKMGLPATQPLGLMMLASGGGIAAQPVSPANSGVSERKVRVRLASDCYIEMDNAPVELGIDPKSGRLGVKRTSLERRIKRVRVSEERYEYDADVEVEKSEWVWGGAKKDESYTHSESGEEEEEEAGEEWIVKRAQWRLRVEPVEGEGAKMQVVLCGVKIEGFTIERSRNRQRAFSHLLIFFFNFFFPL